jgi:hypothetical protein
MAALSAILAMALVIFGFIDMVSIVRGFLGGGLGAAEIPRS